MLERDEETNAPHGAIGQTYMGGYGSPILGDGTSFTYTLCEPCLAALFLGFAIPPAVHDKGQGATWIDVEARLKKGIGRTRRVVQVLACAALYTGDAWANPGATAISVRCS